MSEGRELSAPVYVLLVCVCVPKLKCFIVRGYPFSTGIHCPTVCRVPKSSDKSVTCSSFWEADRGCVMLHLSVLYTEESERAIRSRRLRNDAEEFWCFDIFLFPLSCHIQNSEGYITEHTSTQVAVITIHTHTDQDLAQWSSNKGSSTFIKRKRETEIVILDWQHDPSCVDVTEELPTDS